MFEWEPKEGRGQRRQARRLSFEEASTCLPRSTLGRIVDDPRHSLGERRYVLLGLSDRQKLLAVMFTEQEETIRIISARRATRRERKGYV